MKQQHDWLRTNDLLFKKVEFKNQTELAEAVVKIAKESDRMNHHADMTIRYNQLDISLTTYDKGGLTNKDFLLQEKIDDVIKKGAVI